MEDGRHWELQRLYQDFYDLQINLIQAFPREAGNVPNVERSLPYMPGPVTYVTDNISNGRRANLDEYIRNLLKLGQHITKDYLVCKFFAPREGDYEIEPDANDPYRMSSGSQGGQTAVPSNGISPPSTSGLSGSTAGYGYNGQASHNRQMSGAGSPPVNPYAQGQGLGTVGSPPPGAGGAAVKIKVFFGPENCVVIRMPQDFRFVDLYKKLQERRRLEPGLADMAGAGSLEICWRDDMDNKLWRMENDADLQAAMGRNSKLTLNVRPV
jgi:bud emergence protein 1